MRRIAPVLIALPLLAAASAPVQPAGVPLDSELQQARAEQSAAEAEAAKLERVAAQAQGEAERLRAEQAAAAQNIEAAEARITAADTQLRLASAYVAAHRQRLTEEQRPVASLLAGLADDVGFITMPDGHRIAVAIFTRGGTDRPRTIAEATREIYDGFKAMVTWPFGSPAFSR